MAAAMATTSTHVPVEVYLQSDYEHDCDYVDGEIEERPVGGWDHATWQKVLLLFFALREKQWKIVVQPELRVQISAKRYRVPDVCLVSGEAPIEQIVTRPPLAVFEVLSPEDRVGRVLERLADYDSIGVSEIWVIDPESRKYYRYSSGQLGLASSFVLPGTQHQVEMAEIAALIG